MSRSVLLQLARDSIQEVLEAQRTIDKSALLQEHPLLNENINLVVNIFIADKLKSSYEIKENNSSLINNIIIGAKKAAFESGKVITTSEYLHSEIELVLDTPDGKISQRDAAIIS
jgi:predicted transcriptional regulator